MVEPRETCEMGGMREKLLLPVLLPKSRRPQAGGVVKPRPSGLAD
jgi:hypothetical protein